MITKKETYSILGAVKMLERPVFTTHELVGVTGKSSSTIVQSLNRLERQGVLIKIHRGIWGEAGSKQISALEIIPFLFPLQRVYLSFISALHIHGMISQIPQVITLASITHTRAIRTKLGVFEAHQIAPALFAGFDWYKNGGNFLIAEPEKALIDCLYISSRKKNQFGFFPELNFPEKFSFKKAKSWVKLVHERKIRTYMFKKLEELKELQ